MSMALRREQESRDSIHGRESERAGQRELPAGRKNSNIQKGAIQNKHNFSNFQIYIAQFFIDDNVCRKTNNNTESKDKETR